MPKLRCSPADTYVASTSKLIQPLSSRLRVRFSRQTFRFPIARGAPSPANDVMSQCLDHVATSRAQKHRSTPPELLRQFRTCGVRSSFLVSSFLARTLKAFRVSGLGSLPKHQRLVPHARVGTCGCCSKTPACHLSARDRHRARRPACVRCTPAPSAPGTGVPSRPSVVDLQPWVETPWLTLGRHWDSAPFSLL